MAMTPLARAVHYPVWDNTNMALAFREDILNLNALEDPQLAICSSSWKRASSTTTATTSCACSAKRPWQR